MKNKEGLPIHKAHQTIRETTEKVTGNTATRVNLRQALDLSLSKRAYVEDIAPDAIPEFKNYNSEEQGSLILYVLLADLLKRKLWSEIGQNLKNLMASSDLETLKQKNLGWNETVEYIRKYIDINAPKFFTEWANRMHTTESDEMYKQRFGELEDILKKDKRRLAIVNKPEELLRAGYNTGVEFPLGMLRYMPELLKAQGIQPTREKIVEYFLKNLVNTNNIYAAQDVHSFGMINHTLNPRPALVDVGDSGVTNFSPEFFTLNESGKIAMKEGVFEKIHNSIAETLPYSGARDQTIGNIILNQKENKLQLPDGKAKFTWKTCPALFANLINQYEDFFKPILERVLDTQVEYK